MKWRWMIAAIAVGIIVSTWGFINNTAGAESAWPWQNYTILEENAEQEQTLSCPVAEVTGVVNGTNVTICEQWQNATTGLRLGTTWGLGGLKYIVGFAPSKQFYVLSNFNVNATMVYSGSTDTLVVKNTDNTLAAYAHFTERLQYTNGTVAIDFSSPDFTMPSQWPIWNTGLSRNGQWLAVEIINGGNGLLNLTNDTFKQITEIGPMYGYGYNTTENLAVTNDGTTVAVGGVETPWTLLDVRQCGRATPNEQMVECHRVDDQSWQNGQSVWYTWNLSFNTTGTELSFDVWHPNGTASRETVAASDDQRGTLPYLALGDSFTSGEGETDDAFYKANTNTETEKCHLSTRSYPFLMGAELGLETQSVACSGATMNDVVGDASSYKGQSGRLAVDSVATRSTKQTEAVEDFIPGRVPQDVFVETYQPGVITIGIGGNDAGLFSKLKACAMPDECEWVTPKGRAETATEIASLYDRLVSTYSEIHELSPKSKLYVVNYPNIIDADGKCGALGFLFDHDERQLITEGIHYLDQVIGAAAATVGVPVLNVEQALDGQGICDTGLAMNTLRIGNDTELIAGLDWTKLIANETFHPTPDGHQLLAEAIHNGVADLTTHTTPCGEVVCPQATPVPPPDTWLGGDSADVPLSKQVALTDDAIYRGDMVSVTIPSGEFAPGSQVKLSIHSDNMTLADTVAANDGSVQTTVTIPTDIADGYHTIHASGVDALGQPVDLYQTILYGDMLTQPIVETSELPDASHELASAIQTISKAGGIFSDSVTDINGQNQENSSTESVASSPDSGSAAVLGVSMKEAVSVITKNRLVDPVKLVSITRSPLTMVVVAIATIFGVVLAGYAVHRKNKKLPR